MPRKVVTAKMVVAVSSALSAYAGKIVAPVLVAKRWVVLEISGNGLLHVVLLKIAAQSRIAAIMWKDA